jgi:hypothetical protein
MNKTTAFLFFSCACGGGATNEPTTTPTATASATAAPIASAAPTATADDSPQSTGTRHKKVGNGWFLSGGGKDSYEAIYEPDTKVVVMKPTSDPHGQWATLMKNVAAAPYAGKKIRVRLFVKGNGVTGRGEVWARASAPHSPEDAPSTTTPIAATGEMKEYAVTIDVKDNARIVEYGASIAGPGELRVGADAIDVLP